MLKGRELYSGTQFGKTLAFLEMALWPKLDNKLRQQTQAKYQAAIRIMRVKEIEIRNVRMANCLCNDSSKNLWMEIKKIKKANGNIPTFIDRTSGDHYTAQLFARKFDNLYNSVFLNSQNDMICLSNTLEDLVGNLCNCIINDMIHQHLLCISECDIVSGIKQMKYGKHC